MREVLAARPRAVPRTAWSEEELSILRFEWQFASKRELMWRLPGRSWAGIVQRAAALRLPFGVPEGFVSITDAAESLGFHVATLRSILAWAGVPVLRTYTGARKRQRSKLRSVVRWHVDLDRARSAVERWLSSETPESAARTRGLCGVTLRAWLLRAGLISRGTQGQRQRVPSDAIDRVVAEHMRVAA